MIIMRAADNNPRRIEQIKIKNLWLNYLQFFLPLHALNKLQ